MKHRLMKLSLLTCLLLSCPTQVRSQSEWQKIAPLGESFTFLMPTPARSVSRLVPIGDKNAVPARVFYSLAGGRRYMFVSFARTSPDRMPALSSFDEFTRAMEFSFASKQGEIKSLTFDTDLSDGSRFVRQYDLQMGEYKGVARFTANEKSFYAQIVIGADKNDSDVQRFLTSFRVVSDNDDPDATNVVTLSEGATGSPDLPPDPWPGRFSPISGGVLNGKALSLARPEYPKAARKNHDEGQVRVRIVIDEFGKVISAEAIEGAESLREAAIDAAYKSRFTPTRLMGQPVKISGVIVYNFIAQ
jgi:TonB family protein